MGKFVCSSDDKEAWQLPPGEASKQTFETKEEAIGWFENEFQGQELELGGYVDQDHTVHIVRINDKSVGRIDEYPDLK